MERNAALEVALEVDPDLPKKSRQIRKREREQAERAQMTPVQKKQWMKDNPR